MRLLELDDSRWGELAGSYGDSTDVARWLLEAQETGTLSSDRLGDLVNEIAHQGDASPALYAVIPYLVAFADARPKDAVELLSIAGWLCAQADRARSLACPEFLRDDYDEAKQLGAALLTPQLTALQDFEIFKDAVGAIAGFVGHWELACFLDPLELVENRWHHPDLEPHDADSH